jgi:penicillin-binding protein 1A
MIKAYFKEIFTQPEFKIYKWIWVILLSGISVLCLSIIILLIAGIPSFTELENPNNKIASQVYDDQNQVFGVYFLENRVPIAYKEINPYLKEALIATEDERFFDHSGIDLYALGRVLTKTIFMRNEESGGGSTISQQLAKQLFERPSTKGRNKLVKTASLLKSKLKEWIISVKLERSYTKEEILMMYFNKFEFINGAHGVESAAKIYFNKIQKELTINEAALLVGMFKNPSFYNPLRFKERVHSRKNLVLSKLEKKGLFKEQDYKALYSQEVSMKYFNRPEQSEGPAPYFRAELTKWIHKMVEEKNLRNADGKLYNVFTDGLKIRTTINLKMQQYAEEASREHMTWLQKIYFNHWRKKDPWTYEADSAQIVQRREALMQRIKASPRYIALRDKHLGALLSKWPKNLKSTDKILDILFKSDPPTLGKGESDTVAASINDLVSQKLIAPKELPLYKNFKATKEYEKIRQAHKSFKEVVMKEFSTPVDLVIFDNDKEKHVTMSPLDSIRHSAMHLQNAITAIDPRNGHVKTWVGGLNYDYYKYDHVTSRRSVGSTMKPFVYTAAMVTKGIKPCQEYQDIQYTISPGDANFHLDEVWKPNNSTETFTTNMYNLYHGLLYSKNSITLKLLKEMGSVDELRNLLDKVGISKNEKLPGGRLAVPEFPSICLGAADLSLLQMTAAYTTFSNQGIFREATFVSSIQDRNGKTIYAAAPKSNRAIDPLHNAIMVDMLRNVTSGDFTMGLKTENGGKTGTTNDFADGWFIGITPTLVAGVWTGGDDKFIRFTNLDIGQGYVSARPVFQRFFKKLESDKSGVFDSKKKFAKPPAGFYELTNCQKRKTIPPEVERQMRKAKQAKQDSIKQAALVLKKSSVPVSVPSTKSK